MTPALLLVALVAEDPVVLRAAPSDAAAAQATLWRGDWLEVRGEAQGFLKVWDHRHERPGWVRPAQVRRHGVDEAAAPELRALVAFLRDAGGMESLGIGYAALYLKAAPAGRAAPDVLEALGAMAQRLARQASARRAGAAKDAALAGHLEVAESYGVHFASFDAGGQTRLCYDGEAYRRALADDGADAAIKVRAALGLTSPSCLDPAAGPAQARAWNAWRLDVLGHVDAAAVPAWLGARVRLRRAEVLAWSAYDGARQDDEAAAARAEAAAVRELALVDRAQLAEEDAATYEEAAVRVGASRWAADAAAPVRTAAVELQVAPGREAGETCVRLVARGGGRGGAATAPVDGVTAAAGGRGVLAERCTFGKVWPASLRAAPRGDVLALAVQPLPAWTELWVFHRGAGVSSSASGAAGQAAGTAVAHPVTATESENQTQRETKDRSAGAWTVDTLAPAAVEPDVGTVEAAGFSPDGARLLVAREARVNGHVQRLFQVLRTDTLRSEKQASRPELLLGFKRWSAPTWRASTLALR